MNINRVTIVGGGFAGWYTAAAFAHNFPEINVTIIDSDKFPRIGVGETLGWSAPYDWKRMLGIDNDRMLMWETGAIYKYGVLATDFFTDHGVHAHGKFFNLKLKSLSKFYGEFDYHDFYEPWSKQPGDVGIQQAWLSINQHTDKNFNDYCNELNENSFFVKNPAAPYNSLNQYILRPSEGWSYHIDAEGMVAFLKNLALDGRNLCDYINSPVISASFKDNGDIEGLLLENNTEVCSDLFIDATGFARVLMKYSNNKTWKDAGEEFCNAAWVVPTGYNDPAKEMTGSTNFFGEDHGWGFKVNLYHRVGNGYVFNTNYVDPEIPKQRLLEITEGRRLAEPRLIKWNPGFYETPWIGNTLPLGSSNNFIDPHDASNFDVHTRSLEDLFKAIRTANITEAQTTFNAACQVIAKERQLRLKLNFGLSSRRGKFWDSRRSLISGPEYTDWLKNVINEQDTNLENRYTWFFHQMYYRLIVSTGIDRSQFNLAELTPEDQDMANGFFAYNRARNKYIASQKWPNYYEWLKENRFNGLSSNEVLEKLNPGLVNR